MLDCIREGETVENVESGGESPIAIVNALLPRRNHGVKLGFFKGKVTATFHEDWKMTGEEFLCL